MVKAKSRTTLFGREDGGSVKVNTLDDLKSAVEAVRYKKR